jgi:hypothetical protein
MINDFRCGLTLSGHHMYYGFNHGILVWLPRILQRCIVHIWNTISCRIFGHDTLFGLYCSDWYDLSIQCPNAPCNGKCIIQPKICVSCCKKYD